MLLTGIESSIHHHERLTALEEEHCQFFRHPVHPVRLHQ
jgi:hypothetical protein